MDKVSSAKEMLARHGDVQGQWRVRFSMMDLSQHRGGGGHVEGQDWVNGPLSEALLFGTYLLTEYKSVEVADLHGGTTIYLSG